MDLSIKSGQLEKQKASTIAVAVFEGGKLSEDAQTLNDQNGQFIEKLLKLGDFSGKLGEIALALTPDSNQRVALMGLGNAKIIEPAQFRKAIESLLKNIKSTKGKDLLIAIEGISVKDRGADWQVTQIGELAGTALYTFNEYKSKENQKKIHLHKIQLLLRDKKAITEAKSAAKSAQALANGMDLARTLGNLPGNVCTPSYLASEAKKMARNNPSLSVKIIEEKEMKTLGMGALLSVSNGSDQPAKLIIMDYKGGKKGDQPHVIVGKGITFDTGGISLKPGPDMDQMKFDMCGAASVLGTMKAITDMELPLNVVGVITSAENMPSGGASRPGDIVKTMAGLTVEILNTDAEGRLVLCDALTYVERFKPASVVDIATLTGACIVALGSQASAVMGNNDQVIDQLKMAAENSADRIWQLPLWDEYQQQLDSPFADMANIGGPKAGSITAGCFLSRFTKQYPWAHLDIAGTAWIQSGPEKGSTGRPVPLLTAYLMQQAR